MKRRTATWSVFGACGMCGAALLAWLTTVLLRLEHAEAQARAHAEHEVALGSALWQMDGWLLPILAEEAQRPTNDYLAFNPVQDAYTNLLGKLSPGDVLTQSPLLTYRSDWFPLHFQVDADGTVTSPQVPLGNALDVAQSQTQGLAIDDKRALLERIKQIVSPAKLVERCSTGTESLPELRQVVTGADGAGARDNYSQRAQATEPARKNRAWNAPVIAGESTARPASAGTLVPLWLDDPVRGACLLFVRQVTLQGRPAFQGVLADWDKLSTVLLRAITDQQIARSARLVRLDRPDAAACAHMLTVVPARLEAAPPAVTLPRWTPGRTLLLIAWAALLLTAATVALTLRAALSFGDRRARFASAITHELRTPLTTFRMYSEMLAKGMVKDPERQQQYLTTLQSESDRLARLVENVLGYARIEDGRFTARIERVRLGDLIARLRPTLERRAADANWPLSVQVADADARVATDVDAVGQILFNLVDNACKYGKPPLELTATSSRTQVRLMLRDHGSGVPPTHRARIFDAFDRGQRQPGDNEIPGVGLGLALARELARDLGGDVSLEDTPSGACFVLTLPASSPQDA